MTHPSGNQQGPHLPDFHGGERPRGRGSGRHGEVDDLDGNHRSAGRPRLPLARAGMAAGAVAVLLVIALIVLATTLFRPSDEPPEAARPAVSEPERREPAGGEYVPEGEESEPDSEEVTTITAPTEECEFHPQEESEPQSGSRRTSGDLSFTVAAGWGETGVDWSESLPYATDVASADRQVDEGYYALAQVGQVEWPQEQGGYPGPERAAMAYVQCHLTRPEGIAVYGEEPLMTEYVSEATEVDGHEAWMVRGVVELKEPGTITEYGSVEIVAIVVETPSGPAVFKVSAPADVPDRAADVDAMVDSISVG
ncbi:hypothetical protein M4D54_03040 [Brachybacterium sp. p3-SID1565]|uniref:hypothetical protein n=1 Tax=Brachybacterium sp. p3-SID1565 TaxID=2916046 RepID=UPI0021A8A204|nr:hypothetical protein [Brachybacterium sp. p3-SID1565]MCT1384614.1 hypothetical protein [Brachybacterium sp. p3-SID1565]